MSPHFGRKVVGDAAHAKAVREEKGGAAVFGARVRGAIPDFGPTNMAKRQTEHGPRVTVDATFTDPQGKEVDAVSVEQLKNILAENPTTFDSLYEAELARDGGARPEALDIFLQVETGIKGAMRADVIDEIRQLQKAKTPLSTLEANDANLRLSQIEAMTKRQEQNAKLVDAKAIGTLAKREEDLATIEKHGGELVPAGSQAQLNKLADEQGIDRTGGGERQPTEPSKPDGDVKTETQQPGNQILTPKGAKTAAKTGAKKRT